MRYSRLIAGAALISAMIGGAAHAKSYSYGYDVAPAYSSSSSSYSYDYGSSYSTSGLSLASTGYSAGSVNDVPAGMCPTSCGVSVDAPSGSRVLACYAPCAAPEPVITQAPPTISYVDTPVTTAYRVVRPVIAVPYAVPVMVPNQCGPIIDAPSRYGSSYGYNRCGR